MVMSVSSGPSPRQPGWESTCNIESPVSGVCGCAVQCGGARVARALRCRPCSPLGLGRLMLIIIR